MSVPVVRQIPGVQALTPQQLAEADRPVMATVMDTPINVTLAISGVIGAAVMGLTSYASVADRLLWLEDGRLGETDGRFLPEDGRDLRRGAALKASSRTSGSGRKEETS